MANPNISAPQNVYKWRHGVKLTTTSAENLIGNAATSGKLILVTPMIWLYSGSASANISISLRDAAGTPICDTSGPTAITVGTDVVTGTDLGGPTGVSVPVGAGVQLFEKFPLHESTSLVFTASAANVLAVWLDIAVLW